MLAPGGWMQYMHVGGWPYFARQCTDSKQHCHYFTFLYYCIINMTMYI